MPTDDRYDVIDRLNTYRIKVTTWPNGRKRTLLVPGATEQEAENRVRKQYPSTGGYSFNTKKVADYWRERKD
jgi:hypothetical protein